MTLHRAELSDNLIFQMIILSPLPDCLWCVEATGEILARGTAKITGGP